MYLFVVSVEFAPPPPDSIAGDAALALCDAAGVLVWRRPAGFVWCTSHEARQGAALAVRGTFHTLTEAAADACICLGLSEPRH